MGSDRLPKDRRAPDVPQIDILDAMRKARVAFILTDAALPDNPVVFVNSAFEELTGYGSDEVVGRNCRFLQGPMTDRATIDMIRDAMVKGESIDVEVLNYRKDGSQFWNNLFISPVQKSDGSTRYHFACQFDRTAMHEAADKARALTHMEALGQVTGGVVHDLGNIFQILMGYGMMLEEAVSEAAAADMKLPRTVTRASEQILKSTRRAVDLVDQLLDFSRRQAFLRQTSTDLSETIKQFVGGLAHRTIRRSENGAAIGYELALTDGVAVNIDVGQLEMALLNILINARDAMPDGGVVTISSYVEYITAENAPTSGLGSGPVARLRVSDTGTGIDAKDLPHLMKPFFSTKKEKGTGLGLSTVQRFVKASGGAVTIANNERGPGAKVDIYLPIVGFGGQENVCEAEAVS